MEALKAKEAIFDRIEQSFELFKDNFLKLVLPIFAFGFITKTVLFSIITYFGIKYGTDLAISLSDKTNLENLGFLNYGSEIMIAIIVGFNLLIIFAILYIPFILGTIKSIKQSYNGEEIKVKENIIYGFKNILKSFQTYWFIFAYVALIPAIIGIVGGFLAIYGMYFNDSNYTQIGAIISGFALLLFLIFSIYRGIKSSFSIYSAIDKEEYTKQNFIFSIEITKNKWWRILGNIILTGLILGMVVGMIKGYISSFSSSFDFSSLDIDASKIKENPQEIIKFIPDILKSYSPFENLIINTIEKFLDSIIIVFMMIFTYILFKRLEIEKKIENGEEKIEL